LGTQCSEEGTERKGHIREGKKIHERPVQWGEMNAISEKPDVFSTARGGGEIPDQRGRGSMASQSYRTVGHKKIKFPKQRVKVREHGAWGSNPQQIGERIVWELAVQKS